MRQYTGELFWENWYNPASFIKRVDALSGILIIFGVKPERFSRATCGIRIHEIIIGYNARMYFETFRVLYHGMRTLVRRIKRKRIWHLTLSIGC